MVQPRTEEPWCCQHERPQLSVHRHRSQGGSENLHVDTMRTAEAIVDMRSCWLGWDLTARILINCSRARDGRSAGPCVLVLECAQARVGEISCRPEQQDHHHRLSEPAVPPPGHLHTIAEASRAPLRGADGLKPWAILTRRSTSVFQCCLTIGPTLAREIGSGASRPWPC